jgi:hypothetical protein
MSVECRGDSSLAPVEFSAGRNEGAGEGEETYRNFTARLMQVVERLESAAGC